MNIIWIWILWVEPRKKFMYVCKWHKSDQTEKFIWLEFCFYFSSRLDQTFQKICYNFLIFIKMKKSYNWISEGFSQQCYYKLFESIVTLHDKKIFIDTIWGKTKFKMTIRSIKAWFHNCSKKLPVWRVIYRYYAACKYAD